MSSIHYELESIDPGCITGVSVKEFPETLPLLCFSDLSAVYDSRNELIAPWSIILAKMEPDLNHRSYCFPIRILSLLYKWSQVLRRSERREIINPLFID